MAWFARAGCGGTVHLDRAWGLDCAAAEKGGIGTGVETDDDRAAIAALVFTYAERMDAGDLAGVAALFDGAVYRSARGGRYEGAAAVREVLGRLVKLHDDGTPRTKHVTTNLMIEIDPAGTATARSYFTVFQQTATVPLQAIVAGRYEDRFVRGERGWRFADRLIHMDLVGNLSDHLNL